MTALEDLQRELVADAAAQTPSLPQLAALAATRRRRRVASTAAFGVVVATAALAGVVTAAGGGSAPEDEVVLGAGAAPVADDGRAAQFEGGVDAIVYLAPDAQPSTADAVGALLEGDPGVRSFRYLDQSAAYEEFQDLFADQPDLLASVTPDIMPTSFEVELVSATCPAVEELRAAVANIDDVREVVSPRC